MKEKGIAFLPNSHQLADQPIIYLTILPEEQLIVDPEQILHHEMALQKRCPRESYFSLVFIPENKTVTAFGQM